MVYEYADLTLIAAHFGKTSAEYNPFDDVSAAHHVPTGGLVLQELLEVCVQCQCQCCCRCCCCRGGGGGRGGVGRVPGLSSPGTPGVFTTCGVLHVIDWSLHASPDRLLDITWVTLPDCVHPRLSGRKDGGAVVERGTFVARTYRGASCTKQDVETLRMYVRLIALGRSIADAVQQPSSPSRRCIAFEHTATRCGIVVAVGW